LPRDPISGRICCDVDPDKISATEPEDEESIEHVETDRRDDEEAHGGNIRRMVMQEGPPSPGGGPRRLTMYLATPDCATSNPSLSSSPWMRGAPQAEFSMLIRRINARSSVSICGRPPEARDLVPAPSVSGRTMVGTDKIDGNQRNQRYSSTKNSDHGS
jgi:hypothetical protein